jgi:hypothetical protein
MRSVRALLLVAILGCQHEAPTALPAPSAAVVITPPPPTSSSSTAVLPERPPIPSALVGSTEIAPTDAGFALTKGLSVVCSREDGTTTHPREDQVAKTVQACKPKNGARLVLRIGKKHGIVLREQMDEKSSDCVAKALDSKALEIDPDQTYECYLAFR